MSYYYHFSFSTQMIYFIDFSIEEIVHKNLVRVYFGFNHIKKRFYEDIEESYNVYYIGMEYIEKTLEVYANEN